MKQIGTVFLAATFAVLLASGCQHMPMTPPGALVNAQMTVNGVTLPYIEQGAGAPVVCVHGAFSDLRAWDPQREAIASRYRFIAYSQRYFGTGSWPDAGEKFSQQTHIADLVAFIRQLNAGPVHLVGRSYGATIAIETALEHPELVRAVFAYEPSIGTLVSDPTDQSVLAQERAGLADARKAATSGQDADAVRLFADWTNGEAGAFDKLPPATRAAHVDNGRTVKLAFASPPGPRVSCADLAKITPPLAISTGEFTRPFYRIFAQTTHRCAPGSQLITIPGARHFASAQNSAAFNAALLKFLAGT